MSGAVRRKRRATARFGAGPAILVFGLVLAALASTPVRAQPATGIEAFMVQAACLDERGAPRPGTTPLDPDCRRQQPLDVTDRLPYRKHDWPAQREAAALPRGYQASDSLRGTLFGRPAIIQTMDFGAGQRAFGRFDPAGGDGGHVVVIRNRDSAAILTEAGGTGIKWFQGESCRSEGAPTAGWLFSGTPLAESWQSRLVRLRIARSPQECPRAFDPSFTRWRRARIDLPWRDSATGEARRSPAEIVVSEHYGGASIERANHLERFWFARGLGMVRWERWENAALSRRANREQAAAVIAASGRCPPITFSDPPAEGWEMVDCRTWTNIVRQPPGSAGLTPLAWPEPALR